VLWISWFRQVGFVHLVDYVDFDIYAAGFRIFCGFRGFHGFRFFDASTMTAEQTCKAAALSWLRGCNAPSFIC